MNFGGWGGEPALVSETLVLELELCFGVVYSLEFRTWGWRVSSYPGSASQYRETAAMLHAGDAQQTTHGWM